jgi:hypothetical protein
VAFVNTIVPDFYLSCFLSYDLLHLDCKFKVENDVPLDKNVAYLNEHPEIPHIDIHRQQEFLDNQKKETYLTLR